MKVGAKVFRKMVHGYKILSTRDQTLVGTMPVTSNQVIFNQLQGLLQGAGKEEKKKVTWEGYPIPQFSPSKVRPGSLIQEDEGAPKIQMSYPLIPAKPTKGQTIYSYTKIFWDQKTNKYIYWVVEPQLTDKIKDTMSKIKDLLEQKLDVDLSKLNSAEAKGYLNKQIDGLISFFRFNLDSEEREILKYYIERDFIGLGKIEPMMRDEQVEDISCDGVGVPIFVFHRNSTLGSVISNIVFNDSDELDSFITRLAQVTGKSISVAQPLVDGTLPDGSRLQATLATDIARKGSNFTIRKFTEEPLTPVHLLNYGTIDVKTLAYLWMAVDMGRSILVSGGTASGKTSLLNVLSLFIRPDKKIVSIEDTAELKLPHPHWVPTVARTSVSEEGKSGQVDMYELLKESFRQRPDYIIVGEVRGKEAYILFQQIATGHPSLATIHAENTNKLFDRLTTRPISLPPSLIGSLDLIVFLMRMRYKDKFVRRVSEVMEMIEFDPESKRPVTNRVFKWNASNDKFETENDSAVLKRITDVTGLNKKAVTDEFERRMLILNWMKERNVVDYKDVYRILNMYYSSPSRVIAAITGEAI